MDRFWICCGNIWIGLDNFIRFELLCIHLDNFGIGLNKSAKVSIGFDRYGLPWDRFGQV